MGFCSCTVKFLLFFFNLICALVGLTILASAVYFYLQVHTIKDLASGYVSITFIIMMILGGVTFIVAFLGCCGAVNEDPCCISTYATLLSVIVACQLVLAGVLVYFAQGDEVEKLIRKELERVFDPKHYDENAKAIDVIQTTFSCCGYTGPDSIANLPSSCCPKQSDSDRSTLDSFTQSIAGKCNLANAYKQGCANKIVNLVNGGNKNGSIILFVIGGVELLCIIAAFCIANSLRRERVPYSY